MIHDAEAKVATLSGRAFPGRREEENQETGKRRCAVNAKGRHTRELPRRLSGRDHRGFERQQPAHHHELGIDSPTAGSD